ncbi:hypothetical protein MD484_g613, partial [Candolleomyces efflorescens]
MAGPRRLVLLFSLLSTFILSAWGKRVDRTIDDGYDNSDPSLNHTLHFVPEKNGHWNSAGACGSSSPFCLPADPSRALEQTWTSTALFPSTVSRTIVMDFIGTTIEVFLTLVESGPSNYSTRCTFAIDDETPAFSFDHIPRDDGLPLSFIYQQRAFNREKLKYGRHKLVISVASSSYLNFDYAEYSFDDELDLPPSTAPLSPQQPASSAAYGAPTATGDPSQALGSSDKSRGVIKAAIIGGSISGTILLIAIVAFLLYFYRNRHRRDQSDRLTFGVPSTYAGSTRKLSLPFWPHKPAEDFQHITPSPEKRTSIRSYESSRYSEKYEPNYPSQIARPRDRKERRSIDTQGAMLSPANALMQSFFPTPTVSSFRSKRGSQTTGKLSRLEDSLSPASSSFPRNLSRFSDVPVKQVTDTGVTISSSNVLPLHTPTYGKGGHSPGSFLAV